MNNNSSSGSGSADGDHKRASGPLRLSFRNPHSGGKESISFKNGQLMSPRTTIQTLPSSTSHTYKEVPRSVLNHFNDTHQKIPSEVSFKISDEESLVEDSIQGLEALAASAVASLPRDNLSFVSNQQHRQTTADSMNISNLNSLSEDSKLGKLFVTPYEGDILKFYQEHCVAELVNQAHALLHDSIKRVDEFLQSKSINLTISHITQLFITRLVLQESSRTNKQDFTFLLLDKNFLSSSTAILLCLPRLISVMFSIDQIAEIVGANLFDILLSMEPIFRALPELLSLPNTQCRIKSIQQNLLEEAIWKDSVEHSVLYPLIRAELTFHTESQKLSGRVFSTLNGIRSSQKALEALSGFSSGSRICRLELFFRKYYRLGFQRIQEVTKKLGLSWRVCQMSWEFFVELVQREGMIEGNTTIELFKGRHLNQILLAVVFTSAKLLDQERTFQQISQYLPVSNISKTNISNPKTSTNSSDWISHVYKKSGETCDFFTFYNEIFVPFLQKRIERLVSAHASNTIQVEDRWIFERLFTSAPVPFEPVHQLASNVFVNILNKIDCQGKNNHSNKIMNDDGVVCNIKSNTTKYEFTSPYTKLTPHLSSDSDFKPLHTRRILTDDRDNVYYGSSSIEEYEEIDYENIVSDSSKRKIVSDSEQNDRLKKISKRLDFN